MILQRDYRIGSTYGHHVQPGRQRRHRLRRRPSCSVRGLPNDCVIASIAGRRPSLGGVPKSWIKTISWRINLPRYFANSRTEPTSAHGEQRQQQTLKPILLRWQFVDQAGRCILPLRNPLPKYLFYGDCNDHCDLCGKRHRMGECVCNEGVTCWLFRASPVDR